MFITHERDVVAVDLVGRTSKLLIGPSSGSALLGHNVAYFRTGHAPGHVHVTEEEVFYVADGDGEVWIEGTPYQLRAGTAVHTPQGVVHNIHTTSAKPLRLLGLFSPHAVPGAYPNLPPLSRDLDIPPANRAPFIAYEDERPRLEDGTVPLIRTERVEVTIRRLPGGAQHDIAASGRDLVIHVLGGTGVVQEGAQVTAIEPGTAILLTGREAASLSTDVQMRLLEARTTGWQPADASERSHQNDDR